MSLKSFHWFSIWSVSETDLIEDGLFFLHCSNVVLAAYVCCLSSLSSSSPLCSFVCVGDLNAHLFTPAALPTSPFFFFPISVLMNLETKVECKRLEAASVSSFFTRISPRYDCHRCRDSTPPTCGQITPYIDWCDFILKGFVVKESLKNVVQRVYGYACFGGAKEV